MAISSYCYVSYEPFPIFDVDFTRAPAPNKSVTWYVMFWQLLICLLVYLDGYFFSMLLTLSVSSFKSGCQYRVVGLAA